MKPDREPPAGTNRRSEDGRHQPPSRRGPISTLLFWATPVAAIVIFVSAVAGWSPWFKIVGFSIILLYWCDMDGRKLLKRLTGRRPAGTRQDAVNRPDETIAGIPANRSQPPSHQTENRKPEPPSNQ